MSTELRIGDRIKVKPGFARHRLVPRRIARWVPNWRWFKITPFKSTPPVVQVEQIIEEVVKVKVRRFTLSPPLPPGFTSLLLSHLSPHGSPKYNGQMLTVEIEIARNKDNPRYSQT